MSTISSDRYPWLTKSFFERILKTPKLHYRVIEFELHDAVAKGENYGSQMIRAAVNYYICDYNDSQQKSFIIKTALSGDQQVMIDSAPVFAREAEFYRDILPNVIELSELAFNEKFKFAPTCYDVSENPLYLVLEDLKPDGYRNMDKRSALNFRATEMVLKKVARYHAIGAALYTENFPDMYAHKKKPINLEDTQINEMLMCGMKDCQELSRNWPGYEHLSSKFEKLNKVYIDKVQTIFETDDSEFNVVTHGDLWSNNIMFKYDDENNPIDVILVDFQTGFIGSPAIDLSYLLYTSTSNDVGEKEWDRLLQIYHVELVTTLKVVGYSEHIPTLTEIQIQMLKRSYYAVMISLINVGVRYLEKTEHADLDLLNYDNEKVKSVRQQLYDKPEVRDRLFYLLDFFERKGFLEIE